MEKKMVRIVIADDHELTRAGVRSIFANAEDIQIVGEAKNGIEAQALVKDLHPDILLLDLVMPDIRPYEIDKWVRANCLGTTVLILTAHDRDCYLSKAIDSGVSGVINKSESSERLLKAVYRVVEGKKFFTEEQLERGNTWRLEIGRRINSLSKRELEVLRLVAQGASTQGHK